MKKIVAAVEKWWLTRIQSHVSTVLIALALLDLTPYAGDISALIGKRGYAALRIIGLGAIWWRALQVRFGPPQDKTLPK